jgi:hypothetical protein
MKTLIENRIVELKYEKTECLQQWMGNVNHRPVLEAKNMQISMEIAFLEKLLTHLSIDSGEEETNQSNHMQVKIQKSIDYLFGDRVKNMKIGEYDALTKEIESLTLKY